MASDDEQTGSSGFDLADILEIAARRWHWVALGAATGLTLGVVLWWALPQRYEAMTTILVEPSGLPESYVRSTITLEVKQRIGTLHQRVTSHANLNQLIDLIGTERLDPKDELTREELMRGIRENLTVAVHSPRESASSVVELRLEGRAPEVVAELVREIANRFIAENHKDRGQQAAATSAFLDRELDRIRRDVTAQEALIRDFRSEELGSLPSQLEANMRELDRLNESLASNLEAQERLGLEINMVANRKGSAADPSSLRVALSHAREELIEARRVYTEDHPSVRSLRAQIEQLELEAGKEPTDTAAELDPVAAREAAALSLNLNSRRGEERLLRERIAKLQARVEEAPTNEQRMLELTRDYDTLKQTYHLLLGNKHDAALARNLEDAQMAEQFKLLRPARTPDRPFSPDPRQVFPVGLAVGLGLAGLAILLAELRQPVFHSPEALARRLGLPIFASIPDLIREKVYSDIEPPEGFDWTLVVPGAPNSAAAEQYRGFVPHFLDSRSCRVILVTSAQPGDGKSVTCANLACTLAADVGRRVLLIDADMRRASQHRLVGAAREPGLSDILQGEAELGACTHNVVPNLSLLPAGTRIENPLALLTDEAFLKLIEQARENYEVVLIDSPPILPVIDAKILRKMADMVVFVVRAGVSPSVGVVRSLRELQDVAGVVFNRVSAGSFRRYYYYDAYSQYEYRDAPAPSEGGLVSKIRQLLGRKGRWSGER